MSIDNTSASARVAPRPSELLTVGPILLYDGECGVCAASVQWILAHERSTTLRFAPQQSEVGIELRRVGQVDDRVDSLIWVEPSEADEHKMRALIWSDAVLAVLHYVGGPWKFLTILRWVPRPIRHAAYRLFASRRSLFAPVSCLLPSQEERARFLAP